MKVRSIVSSSILRALVKSTGARAQRRGGSTRFGAKVAALTLVFAAAFVATLAPLAPSRAQEAQSVEAKPQQVKLDFQKGNKKTGLKLFLERGALAKVTATDSAGTRNMKRTDKLAVPCPDGERECKTVELEDGTSVDACYCKGSDAILIALLVPAVQKVREAAARSQTSDQGGGPRVKVFDGNTGAAEDSERKMTCWADEKLKLTFCTR
jgi:hypothetical protein